VGTTLYEAVAGSVPFSAASVTEVCSLVLEREPTPLPDHVPPALAAVILKCLEKDPERRYQNVGELALELVPFAPSGSRLWAERVVSLLNAHGASLDASGLRSEPPPSMPSSRRLRGPPSGSNSLPLALSMPTLASRPDDETAPDGRIPLARTTRPARGSQLRAAAIGTLCALVVIGVVALGTRRAWMPTRAVAPVTEPARGDTLADPAAAAPPVPSTATPTEPGAPAAEPAGAVANEPSASRPKVFFGSARAPGAVHAPSAPPAAASSAPVAASASSPPAASPPTPPPSSSAAPPAASSGRPKILDDSKRPKLLE
jgi:eukaryotic-like serine/threonine-protein kinase